LCFLRRAAELLDDEYLHPLSIAFLDNDGVIINIADMKPLTTDSTARPSRQYALEMNQGWFAKRGIKPGRRVDGLERASAPR